MRTAAERRYEPGLDWLKAIGLTLIVHGHVAARTVEWLTPPFYPKQVGVALFVFATGFTLARERRPAAVVLTSRLLELIVIGLACALVVSAAGLVTRGDPAESNYLPILGLHLVLSDLPANPTTWYIGTYLHLLLFWALVLRGRESLARHTAIVFLLGIAIRGVLILAVGPPRAYMALFNWMDVLLMGMRAGSGDGSRDGSASAASRGVASVLMAAWPVMMGALHWTPAFPFMVLDGDAGVRSAFGVSAAVSIGYVLYTWSTWTLVRAVPAPAPVMFLARNTVLVVIAHMPVYYLLEAALTPTVPSFRLRATLELALCLGGLAAVSALLRPGHWLRRWVWVPPAAPTPAYPRSGSIGR